MDGERFDRMTRGLLTGASRRSLLAGLIGGAAATIAGAELLEARKGGSRRRRGRVRGQGKGKGNGKGGGSNCEGASTDDLAFTGFGGAVVSGDTATLVSNSGTPFSGLDFELPGPVAFSDITELSVDYDITAGDCGQGAPRFQLNIADDPGPNNVFVYIGPFPNYTACGLGPDSTGNLVETDEARFDVTQLTCDVAPANAFYATYEEAAACIGDRLVEGIQLVVDNGNIAIDVDPTVALGDDVEIGPPTSKDQCKNCGWASFTTPRTFKNQGDCIQFVNTGK
jgi:hypothetical protein